MMLQRLVRVGFKRAVKVFVSFVFYPYYCVVEVGCVYLGGDSHVFDGLEARHDGDWSGDQRGFAKVYVGLAEGLDESDFGVGWLGRDGDVTLFE